MALLALLGAMTPLVAATGPDASPAAGEARPLIRTYVLRDDFASILSRRSTSGRLIPVKQLKELLDRERKLREDDERDQRRKAKDAESRFPRAYVVRDLAVRATMMVDRRLARVVVTVKIDVMDGDETEFAVPTKGMAMERVQVDGKDALFEPASPESFRARIQGLGSHELVYEFVMPLGTEGYTQVVGFPLPAYPSGKASVEIPGQNLEVRVESGVDTKKKEDRGRTAVESDLAGGTSFKLTWYEVAQHAAASETPDASTPSPTASASPAASTARASQRLGPPLVFATTCHVIGVSDSSLVGLIDVQYEIHRGPIDSVTLKVPRGVGPVEIVAPPELFQERRLQEGEQKLTLSNPQEGTLSFALRYKVALKKTSSAGGGGETRFDAALPDFEPVGTAAETGYVVVNRIANVQIDPTPGSTLLPIDGSTLPDSFAHHRSTDSLFTYRYLAHPASLALNVTRYEDASVLVGVVDSAFATTHFSPDGGRVTSIEYRVRTQRNEFLKLRLPAGTILEQVTVDSSSVGASQDSPGSVMVPLRSAGRARGELTSVRIAFRHAAGSDDSNRIARTLAAELPELDLPVLRVHWRWVLPAEMNLSRFTTGSRILTSTRYPPHAHEDSPLPAGAEQGHRVYYLSLGLVPKDHRLEVSAVSRGPVLRFTPMVLLFLLGGIAIYLALRFLFYGTSPHLTLGILALSYVVLTCLEQEPQLTRPFRAGLDLTAWLVVVVVAFRILAAIGRKILPAPTPATTTEGGDAR